MKSTLDYEKPYSKTEEFSAICFLGETIRTDAANNSITRAL